MTQLIAYNGDAKLKEMFVEEIEAHRKADQIIKGTYGKGTNGDWKGCAVGCSIHSLNKRLGTSYATNDHTVYEKALGIPEWLARLEDTLFEGLPQEEAMQWPTRFSQAIPVGANLDAVKWKFCAFLLKENIERVLSLKIDDALKEQVVAAIRGVLSLHETAIITGEWDESAASAAASAAESAMWAAAESAASAAESAAWSAMWAAAESARSAARSAAASAASAESARSAAYQRYADHLIELLKDAPQQMALIR